MSANTTDRPDVAKLSYEQARDELIEVVRHLEAGSTSLEDALDLWERGEALAVRCQTWLDGARERLDAARDGTRTSAASAADAVPPGATREVPPGAAREAAMDDDAALPEEPA